MVDQIDMATVRARLTCAVCNKYFREATTINECLHTFCKKCIHDKLTGDDEESENETETFNCPVCDAYLGPAPLEKLRPDHSLQNFKNLVFPLRRRKAKKLKVGPSEDPPATGTVVSTKNNGKSLSTGEASQSVPKGGTENAAEQLKEQSDDWQLLNRLAEASKFSNKRNKSKVEVDNEKAGKNPVSSGGAKSKKEHREKGEKERATGESSILGKAACGSSTSAKVARTTYPIWFSLMASEEQDGDARLQQIPSHYLQILDGSMPVSIIRKHICRKLDLRSEDEVEIKCLGIPVVPTMQMRELVGMWVQAMPSWKRIPVTVGSSGKDFVMVVEYARKVPTPEPQPQPEISVAT